MRREGEGNPEGGKSEHKQDTLCRGRWPLWLEQQKHVGAWVGMAMTLNEGPVDSEGSQMLP